MFKIIKTAVSKDEKKLYAIYRYKAEFDGIYKTTYGISVCNGQDYTRVNAIAFDEESALKLLDTASENSVSAFRFQEFLDEYFSEH